MDKIKIHEIQFVPSGFKKDKTFVVYYFKFDDGKIYIGKTGTSNLTGCLSAYERLGTHLRKRGKTKSVIWDNLENEDRMNGFTFGFVQLPQGLDAGKIEFYLISQLKHRARLINQVRKSKKVLSQEENVEEFLIANELLNRIL